MQQSACQSHAPSHPLSGQDPELLHLGQPQRKGFIHRFQSSMASGVEVLTLIPPTSRLAANWQVYTKGHGPLKPTRLHRLQTEGME